MVTEILAKTKIGIIGAGHMGTAIARGLATSGAIPATNITISNPTTTKIELLQKDCGVRITHDNTIVARDADIVIIAVKPVLVEPVIREIAPCMKDKIMVSLAAKITMRMLYDQIGAYCDHLRKPKLVRIMPNLPVTYHQGVLGMMVGSDITTREKEKIASIFSLLGKVIEVRSEEDLDTLTLLSGCGPGLVAYMIQLFSKYAESYGLSPEMSDAAILQTMTGTITYLERSRLSAADLQKSVATPGGITEAILTSLKKSQFENTFIKAMDQGRKKLSG